MGYMGCGSVVGYQFINFVLCFLHLLARYSFSKIQFISFLLFLEISWAYSFLSAKIESKKVAWSIHFSVTKGDQRAEYLGNFSFLPSVLDALYGAGAGILVNLIFLDPLLLLVEYLQGQSFVIL
jgi:hypothetical protein